MDKKRFNIKILLVLIAIVIIAGICAIVYFSNHHYTSEADDVKQLLTSLRDTLNPYDKKSYQIAFEEKYSLSNKDIDDLQETDFSIDYDGKGAVIVSLQMNEDINNPSGITADDFITNGKGELITVQQEKYKYHDSRTYKDEAGSEPVINDSNYEVNNQYIIKTDEENFYVVSERNNTNYIEPDKSKTDSFNGKININSLKDTIALENVNNATSNILFLNTWEFIKQISQLSDKMLKEIDLYNVKEVKNFIEENEIVKSEEKDPFGNDIIKISFALNTEKLLSELYNKNFENAPKIKGYMNIDKNTGDIKNFKYDIKDYFYTILSRDNIDKEEASVQVDNFVIEGYAFNTTIDQTPLNREFEEYSDDKKSDFLMQLNNHLYPYIDGTR